MEEIRWRLLVRVFSSEASPGEKVEFERWRDADPANTRRVDALRRIWETSGELPRSGDAEAAWNRVAERAKLRGSLAATVHPIRRLHRGEALRPAGRSSRWGGALLQAAAAVTLVVGAAALRQPLERLARSPLLERTIATGKGERIHLVLSDGTQVLLGPDSRLRYPRRFGREARDVYLQGVAYFEVERDPERPFSVRAPDAVTRVLGTKFAVRDYPGGEPARVVVSEGRVAVRPTTPDRSGRASAAVLTRGQALDLPSPGLPAVIDSLDTQQDLGWTRGVLSFKNAPVPDVLMELGRWYDVEVSASDPSIASQRLTIAFDQQPLEVILQEIALALGARVERNGKSIRLVPAPTARAAPASYTARVEHP